MLRTIATMLSQHTYSVDKTVEDAVLMVARHAPRWRQMLIKHGAVPASV